MHCRALYHYRLWVQLQVHTDVHQGLHCTGSMLWNLATGSSRSRDQ